MRTATIISAFFAAAAFAQPLEEKRDVVVETQVNVVYTTVAPGAAPTPASAPPHAQHLVQHHQQPAVQQGPAPSGEPAPGSYPSIEATDSYEAVAIRAHNHHRRHHKVPGMVWDHHLAASAAQLASRCVFQHDVSLGPAHNYGQNIASRYPPTGSRRDELRKVISKMWYKGEVGYFNGLYGQASPDMSNFEHWGHFTQVVWKDSRRVGCATHVCGSMGYFTVCNYGGAGNMIGEFNNNVFAAN